MLETNDAQAPQEPVAISEDAQAPPETPQEVAPPPVALSEAEVGALIPDHLPDETRERLLAQEYFTGPDARAAIVAEVDYLRAVSGGGRPFGTQSAQAPVVVDLAEAVERDKATRATISKKHFGG